MEQHKEIQEKPGELDLLELLATAISFLRTYARLIAGFFMAGILIAVITYLVLPKVYSSTSLLEPGLLSSTAQVKTINNWNNVLEAGQYDELAGLFNVDASAVSKVESISAEANANASLANNSSAFLIRIRVTDRTVVGTIQKGILYALENGEYVKEKIAAQRASYKELIAVTSNEITKLDSMRAVIEKNMASPKQAAGSVIMDVSEINNSTIAMHVKLLQLKDSLNFAKATHVLQDFYQPGRKDEPKLTQLLSMGAVAGLVLGFIVAFYFSLMQTLRSRKLLIAQKTGDIEPVAGSRLKQSKTH